MKLKSMMLPKKSKAELKKDCCEPVFGDQDKYPWGLQLNLDNDGCKMLGLKPSEYKVGSSVMIHAKAKVVEIAETERQGSDPRSRIEFQITDMAVSNSNSFEGGYKADEDKN
ncbi:MAG: capsid staple protein [Syntrophobacteraceae bacterium]